jgi:hypothetical protein
MLKLAHIVNPLVVTNPASDLSYAQAVTLRSMRIARESVIETVGVQVTHYAAFFKEDSRAVPADFVPTPVLERSVLDFVEPPILAGGRKLPLLRDILDRLYEAAEDAEYLIYSNIDIGLRPDFYLEVARLIREGADAFLIGRRIVSTDSNSCDDLEKIFAQEGEPRVGLSCFVFPRAHYPDYLLDDTCIGLQPVGVTLAINMIQRAAQFRNFSRARLTFHLGDERMWEQTLLDDCHRHNERALDQVVRQLARQELSPATHKLLDGYQRWRARYVIGRTSNPLTRTLYRALRQAGFGHWVASRYDKVR